MKMTAELEEAICAQIRELNNRPPSHVKKHVVPDAKTLKAMPLSDVLQLLGRVLEDSTSEIIPAWFDVDIFQNTFDLNRQQACVVLKRLQKDGVLITSRIKNKKFYCPKEFS